MDALWAVIYWRNKFLQFFWKLEDLQRLGARTPIWFAEAETNNMKRNLREQNVHDSTWNKSMHKKKLIWDSRFFYIVEKNGTEELDLIKRLPIFFYKRRK